MSRIDNHHQNDLALADLGQAVEAVTSEPIDERRIEEAAARVWQRLEQASTSGALAGTHGPDPADLDTGADHGAGALQSCADFQRLIPAYVAGAAALAPARAMLLEDHTRGCIACRRALLAARQKVAKAAAAATPAADAPAAMAAVNTPDAFRRSPFAPSRWRGAGRAFAAAGRPGRERAALAAAAVLAIGLGFGLFWLAGGTLNQGATMARVELIEGNLYQVSAQSSVPVGAGDLVRGDEEIRTAKSSRAVVRMNDGSRIEMSERAGLSLSAGRRGATIRLERGRIIVQAAKQRLHHLYVATADCLVSVTGTIFAVNNGTKGSRVSVIEGEVRVRQARLDSVLHPGEQVSTSARVAAVPVHDEVAWSRDAARYDRLLGELTAVSRDIDRQVKVAGLRNSTRLLDLAPAGSTIYLALPNLAANLGETQRLLEQRLAESPVLRQWWSDSLGSSANEARVHEVIQQIGDLGRNLGDEIAIAAGFSTPAGELGSAPSEAPVLMAEVTQESSFRATLEQELSRLRQQPGAMPLRLIADPATAAPANGKEILLWVGGGVFVASPSREQIARVAANLQPGAVNPFTATPFHGRIAQEYADGAGWLFSADLARLVARERLASAGAAASRQAGASPESPATPTADRARRLAEALGVFDVENFTVDRRDGENGKTDTRAALNFDQPRRGLAAWLAAPGPMGSLGFFSPDASLAVSFVIKNPVTLLDELLSLSPEFAAELAKVEAAHGFNLRNDLAVPLGGEITLGLDGPVLPNPSWKLVAEVYDPVKLQQTFTRVVLEANDSLRAEGKPPVTLQQEQEGSRTYYSLVSNQPAFEVHYVFANGYLVAAPSRALLDTALAQHDSGVTLASSSKFRELLGQDGQINVSALFYQNLTGMAAVTGALAPLAGAGSINGGGGAAADRTRAALARPSLGNLVLGQSPSLLYAYAEDNRILFGGRGNTGPLGVNLATMAGFGGILGSMHQVHGEALAQKESGR